VECFKLACTQLQQWAQPTMMPMGKPQGRLEYSKTNAITTRKRCWRVNVAGFSSNEVASVISATFITEPALKNERHLSARVVMLRNTTTLSDVVKGEFSSTINAP
jgi:hypothetical protein